MAKDNGTFTVSILSEVGVVYYGDCNVLFVPAAHDTIAVLAHHTPMIAMLSSGTVSVKTGRDTQTITTVKSGLLCVGDNEATVLVNL